MALKEIYVDPSIDANSGTGTVGDPYGDLDYAIVQETQGADGTRINIKRGTDEIVTRQLGLAFADTSVSAAWSPSSTSPIIFQGYDAAAGDLAGTGNRAGISTTGGSFPILDGTLSNIAFIDLHLTNAGGTVGQGVIKANTASIIRCEVDNNNSSYGLNLGSNSLVMGCYVHDIAGYGIAATSGLILNNILTNVGTKTMVSGIYTTGGGFITGNLVHVGSTTNGIHATSVVHIINNSIYSSGGSGSGILCTSSFPSVIANNLIEGFSGTGGFGVEHTGAYAALISRNLVYNCETAYSGPTKCVFDLAGLPAAYESLTASPFVDAANFDLRPVDTGTVKEGSIPASFMTI